MTTLSEDIQTIRQTCHEVLEKDAKATKGPWIGWVDEGDHMSLCHESSDGKSHVCIGSFTNRNKCSAQDSGMAALSRNISPIMARGLLALVDESLLYCLDMCPSLGGFECDCPSKSRIAAIRQSGSGDQGGKGL